MHEQSETIKRGKRWVNVYGKDLPKAGKQLPGTVTYATMAEAVDQAKKRSASFGYGHEVQDGVDFYKNRDPRSFTQKNVHAPEYSQAHEDGYVSRPPVFKNPPTDQAYRQGDPDPSGFDRIKSYLSNKLQGPTKDGSALDRFSSPKSWGMGSLEPTHTAAQAIEPLARGAWANVNEPKEFDPTGAVGGSLRPAFGWGKNPITKTIIDRDPGGYSVPTSKMLADDAGMTMRQRIRGESDLPKLWENENRHDYLFGRSVDNDLATNLRSSNPLVQIDGASHYNRLAPQQQQTIDKTMGGQRALQDDIQQSRSGSTGGRKPTEDNAIMFGFQPKTGQRGDTTATGQRYNYEKQRWEPAE